MLLILISPTIHYFYNRHTQAYLGGWAWTIFLIVPQSIYVNLAYQTTIGGADTV